MPARLRVLESLPAGTERPLCLLDGLMCPHGKKKVARDTQLVRNTDGGFSLLLCGRCIVRFQRDHMELRLPRFAANGDMIPPWVLADRLAGVLALWGAEIISGVSGASEGAQAALWVVRGGETVKLVDGLRVCYCTCSVPTPVTPG